MKRYSSAASASRWPSWPSWDSPAPRPLASRCLSKAAWMGMSPSRHSTPPLLHVDVEATGKATHLGKFTLDIPHVVNPATRAAVGTYEFTAANGDKVYAEFTGLATPTAIPGVLYIEETATITGGTGRFAGATGSFISERWYDTVAGTTIGSFKGTISKR